MTDGESLYCHGSCTMSHETLLRVHNMKKVCENCHTSSECQHYDRLKPRDARKVTIRLVFCLNSAAYLTQTYSSQYNELRFPIQSLFTTNIPT
jgi:hypothetical protein